MLRTLAAGVVLSWVGLAAAETRVALRDGHHRPPREAPPGAGLRFGETNQGTRLDRVAVSMRTGPADVRVTTLLTLSATVRDHDAGLTFEVPAGAQVTFLGVTMNGERRIAHLESATDARETYEEIVQGIEDPALLELVSSTDETDTLNLRVFPLQKGKSARVEIIMTLPHARRFVIDPGKRAIPRVDVEVDGARTAWSGVASARAVKLPAIAAPGELPVETDERIGQFQSLFIDRPPVRADRDRDRIRRTPELRTRPRGAFRISRACLENPIARDCM
jgi:hypothetical protein